MDETLDAEIERNLFAFLTMIPSLLQEHEGEYAVLKNKQIIGLFSKLSEALKVADEAIPDGLYSIQRVTDRPVELGFYAHAGHQG